MPFVVDNREEMRFALDRAAKIAGGRMRLAESLSVTKQAVYQWRIAPARRCWDIAALTKGKVSVEELRPDIFRSKRNKQQEEK